MPRHRQQKPCNTPGCGRKRAPRGRYCEECQRAHVRADLVPRFTRECDVCHANRPLEEFTRLGSLGNHYTTCESCRPLHDVSPATAARRIIEKLFDVPSDVWYLHEHPLNHLHYSWTVAINNARAKHGEPYTINVPLNSDLDRLPIAFKRAVNAGFTPIVRHAQHQEAA